MGADERDPGAGPAPESEPPSGAVETEAEAVDGDAPQSGRTPENEASWLGCLWLVVVPGVILGVIVVTLNYLGC